MTDQGPPSGGRRRAGASDADWGPPRVDTKDLRLLKTISESAGGD